MVLYELLHRKVAWADAYQLGDIGIRVLKGERPHVTTPFAQEKETVGRFMVDLMFKCWANRPIERPSFKDIQTSLSTKLPKR